MMDLNTLPTIRAAVVDLNGRLRGKRMPGAGAAKLDKGGLRLPLSLMNVDISGADIEGSPLVFESGDADGIALPTDRGPVPMPWIKGKTALVPVALYTDDGAPFAGDPRHALNRVLSEYSARGWRVLAAQELEFYLVRRSEDGIAPPLRPDGTALDFSEILSIDDLDAFDAFFTEIYEASEAMGLDPQTAICEAGVGQFEVNLNHTDAMRAADDAVLFKTLVKGTARNHGLAATFVAKPYPDQAGSGAHVHFSVVDADGNNIFDNGGPDGTPLLRHAVAGSLKGMAELSLLFTPHGISFERMIDGEHAPTGIGWGYENRTAAIRIPGGPPTARRIENRVAGGDSCPYLMLAAILGSALEGIKAGLSAPDPIPGNAYEADLDQMPMDWDSAISTFESSAMAASIFDPLLIDNLVRTKRQEQKLSANLSKAERLMLYLERV